MEVDEKEYVRVTCAIADQTTVNVCLFSEGGIWADIRHLDRYSYVEVYRGGQFNFSHRIADAESCLVSRRESCTLDAGPAVE